jgi:hypothetical protein
MKLIPPDESSQAYQSLLKAQKKIEDVVDFVNERKREAETLQRVAEIQRHVDGLGKLVRSSLIPHILTLPLPFSHFSLLFIFQNQHTHYHTHIHHSFKFNNNFVICYLL